MKRSCVIIALCVLTGSLPARAFDTQTHAYIAYQAYSNSNLDNSNAATLLKQLGLDRFDAPQPFSPYWLLLPDLQDFYFDNLPSGATPLQYERPVTGYEWEQMQQLAVPGHLGPNGSSIVGSTPFSPLPIANWLIRGAIREDDLKPKYYDSGDGTPPDLDPYGAINRSLDHFYDPIHNIPLTFVATGGAKSVDWALGEVDSFASPPQIDTTRRNHFGWEDARQNEFLALTVERDANSDGVREASEREEDSEERLFRWATAFRSLGDVVHLLQDAAQPQHTRNDRHDDHFNTGERQGFEPFTNLRLIGSAALNGPGADPTGGQVYVRDLVNNDQKLFLEFFTPLPDISGYPVPTFATPLRFFTTRNPGDGPGVLPDNRYGMADYSNRGFFTTGTTPDADTNLAGVFAFQRPDPTLTGFAKPNANCAFLPALRGQNVTCVTYLHSVPDSVQPSRTDATTPEPLLSDGIWSGFFGSTNNLYTISPQTFQVIGNLTIPRAIAYSAGLIDYFFRGQLAVTAPPNRVVGVLNQGSQHTMNAQGYPCVGTASNDGCPIFGFRSIRVSLQNTTPQITESGSGTVSVQNLSDTAAGSVTDPNFTGPYLVAIAKYHRNTCYKPDMSGQPYQVYDYNPPSTGITQPTCGTGETTRTPYQEISVSQSFAATAAQLNGASPFEAHFDFSADPIPVNATDLFIQVVYRGPMGDMNGQEPDAIAVGTLDVREPTFAAFWNNTDYFWNGAVWLVQNSSHHHEPVKTMYVCSGGAPVKLIYEEQGVSGTPALRYPDSGTDPGVVRLGVIFPPPEFPTQYKSIRGVPYQFSGDDVISQESSSTKGIFAQANLENVDSSTLLVPYANCSASLPIDPQYWCFDPVQKRRGQVFGTPATPLYISLSGSNAGSDVDSVPLPVFAGQDVQTQGTIRFDTDGTLANCPAQPSAPITADYQAYLHYLDELEQARDLGVSGDKDPPLQRYY